MYRLLLIGLAFLCPGIIFAAPREIPSGLPKEISIDLGGGVMLEFILVEPTKKSDRGIFHMGSSPREQHDLVQLRYKKRPDWMDEENQTEVTIKRPYYLGKYEFTKSQQAALLGQSTSDLRQGPYPVEDLDWFQAQEIVKRLNKKFDPTCKGKLLGYEFRLPHEKQWEYACRAGSKTTYAFGDSLDSTQANFDGESPWGDAKRGPYLRRTQPVGSYKPNAWGFHDLHGNVTEWCENRYDPQGSQEGNPGRAARGGNYYSTAIGLRSAVRYSILPSASGNQTGLRVAIVSEELRDKE